MRGSCKILNSQIEREAYGKRLLTFILNKAFFFGKEKCGTPIKKMKVKR